MLITNSEVVEIFDEAVNTVLERTTRIVICVLNSRDTTIIVWSTVDGYVYAFEQFDTVSGLCFESEDSITFFTLASAIDDALEVLLEEGNNE